MSSIIVFTVKNEKNLGKSDKPGTPKINCKASKISNIGSSAQNF